MVTISDKIKRQAGILLLGGVMLGSSSMLKAAENYFDDPKQQAIQCYNLFCQEVSNEIEKRRENPEYADKMYMLDLMLEDTLFPHGYDTTVQCQTEVDDLMTDIFKDAIRSTLDQSDWYIKLKDDLEVDIRGVLGFPEVPQDETAGSGDYTGRRSDFFGLFGKKGEEPASYDGEGRGNGLLGYGESDTGMRTSLSGNELRVSAYAALHNLKILGAEFEKGKIEVGSKNNGRIRAYLENAISDEISCRVNFNVEDVQDPGTDVSLGLTGKILNGRWEASVGYHDGGDERGESGAYANFGLVGRF
ncbi:MAG: hypothetical protein ACYTEL_26465 [Planctomycetota bacterium]|jgi:hypothetical protein